MVAEVAQVRALFQRPLNPAAEKGFKSDDRAEFVGVLFERHGRTLLWYLMKLTPNREDAEEVAQEAYLRLLRVAGLETDAVRARNYLFRTATNLVRDNYRRRTARCEQRHVALEDLQLEAQGPTLDRVVDAERAAAIVSAALRDLRPRPRKAFLLHVNEEMTYERIAVELGVSKKTVERDIAMTVEVCRSRLARWRDR